MLYRVAEMCGRWDIDTLAEEIPISALVGWARYWTLKNSRIGGFSDATRARQALEGMIGGR